MSQSLEFDRRNPNITFCYDCWYYVSVLVNGTDAMSYTLAFNQNTTTAETYYTELEVGQFVIVDLPDQDD